MKYRLTLEQYEALPEAEQKQYKEGKNDTFVLDVEGYDDEGPKVKEFRETNIKLSKALKETEAKMAAYKDIDPAKYAELAAKAAKLEELQDKQKIESGDIEEVVAKRTETMRKDYDSQIKALRDSQKALEADAGKYKGNYKQLKTDSAVRAALAKAGALRPGAEALLVGEARSLFTLNDEDQFEAPDLYDDKGTAMDLDGWAKRQIIDRPFLFEAAQGGGAGGGRPGTSKAPKGKQVLSNPSPQDFGKNLEAIASGGVEVLIGD